MLVENVVQPLLVSTSSISLATETVCSIMKIDDVVWLGGLLECTLEGILLNVCCAIYLVVKLTSSPPILQLMTR